MKGCSLHVTLYNTLGSSSLVNTHSQCKSLSSIDQAQCAWEQFSHFWFLCLITVIQSLVGFSASSVSLFLLFFKYCVLNVCGFYTTHKAVVTLCIKKLLPLKKKYLLQRCKVASSNLLSSNQLHDIWIIISKCALPEVSCSLMIRSMAALYFTKGTVKILIHART